MKKDILVHICCSVDSHFFLQELKKEFDDNFCAFFYNPNIHPKSEHDLRLLDVKRSCNMLNIPLNIGDYDDLNWESKIKGLEDEPEKGKRCEECFDIRLLKTAQLAKKLDFKYFTTTLLSSPMKEQNILYERGDKIASMYDLEFIKINVRKDGGTVRQSELAKKDNLYRQNYCGCKHALGKQRDAQKQNGQKQIALEMISPITKQIMPGSIESRYEEFKKRDEIEKNHQNYILNQRKHLVWRLLSGSIKHKKEYVNSYILARSCSKNKVKSGNIIWVKPVLNLKNKYLQNIYLENEELMIGFSKKDDSIFIDIKTLNFLNGSTYENVKLLNLNPMNYNDELEIRKILCGIESINPIIILDSQILFDITIDIKSIVQEEAVYNVIQIYDATSHKCQDLIKY